jgi:hypothetical protein
MTLLVGCVADSTPKYLDQALRLLSSWRWFAGPYSSAEFVVCVIDRVDSSYRRRYEELGARVRLAPRFADRHPTSNKLRFLELDEVRSADRVLMLDCDTIVVQPPGGLFQGAGLTAKIVDVATVSIELFERLFSKFGMPMPAANQVCTVSGEAMIPYFNSGVISLSGSASRALGPAWTRFNGEMTAVFEELGGGAHFCEQASLSLALAATGTPFDTVGNEMNFPAHFGGLPLDSEFANTDPVIIHYHWLVHENGSLLPSVYPKVDDRIRAFNDRLRL